MGTNIGKPGYRKQCKYRQKYSSESKMDEATMDDIPWLPSLLLSSLQCSDIIKAVKKLCHLSQRLKQVDDWELSNPS